MKNVVALKYPKNVEAPFILAKGKNHLADLMLKIAEENGISVVNDENLANTLSFVEIGQCIPEETWKAVASVFAMIRKLEDLK